MPTKILAALLALGLAAPGFAAGETPAKPSVRKPASPRPVPAPITAPADEDLLARTVFPVINKGANHTLTLTWKITVA